MRFNRKKFFDGVKSKLDKNLSQEQVDGFNYILGEIEKDKFVTRLSWAAYFLATAWHEVATRMTPIREYGRGKGKPYSKIYVIKDKQGNVIARNSFYGRGLVQLTWIDNYTTMNEVLRRDYPEVILEFQNRTGQTFDLVLYPDQALDPKLAYVIMSAGMRLGKFGAKLGTYLNDSNKDYRNARRTVNILDKADLIKGYAEKFESILKNSLESSTKPDSAELPKEEAIEEVVVPIEDAKVEGDTQTVETGEKPENTPIMETSEPPVSEVVGQQIRKERPSFFTKIGAAITAVTGLGINAGQLIQGRLEAITFNQLIFVIIGLALVGLAIWWYNKSADRSNKLNAEKLELAADKSKTTTDLIK